MQLNCRVHNMTILNVLAVCGCAVYAPVTLTISSQLKSKLLAWLGVPGVQDASLCRLCSRARCGHAQCQHTGSVVVASEAWMLAH